MKDNKAASKNMPDEHFRCTTVLADTLQGYSGIRQAKYNVNTTQLSVKYDPKIISPERAIHIVREAGREAGARVISCASKSDAACAQCALAMSNGLLDHYKEIANLNFNPATFQNGVIQARIDDTAAPASSLLSTVETIFNIPDQKTGKKTRISRRHLEITFTIITLVATLTAFLGNSIGMSAGFKSFLFASAFLFGGVFGLLDGIKAAADDHKLDVNLLMILAAFGAAVIGQPLEGAILLFLFSLSNTLQSFALERNRLAIEKLLDLRPQMATIRRGSRIETVMVENVLVGDIVLVKPGDRMPVDGEVIRGETDVNQATITGESLPVHKRVGDQIFAGTVNGFGAIEIRSTHLAQDTTLARIVQMVEQAQNSRARTQTVLDKFEQIYAWIILAGAILLILIPTLLTNQDFYGVFYRAMTWLVVASPCALVISTPASILSAIANGAKNGILFKGGIHLEQTAGLKAIAFDKTGTLTTGKPSLKSMVSFNNTPENEMLRLIAAAEARSEHPIGQALLAAAEARNITVPSSTDFLAIPGQGIMANVEGSNILIGNQQLFNEKGIAIPQDLAERKLLLEKSGQTVMLVRQNEEWMGMFSIADTLRPDARQIIQSLKDAGINRTIMLTGDNEFVARSIAEESGVDEIHASLLPNEKVEILKKARKKFGNIAMIGDGVNDAPALAVADVGVAMGGAGSDVALETADVVLMGDDLSNLAHALRLARRARRIIWQNLSFSLLVIIVLVISAFGLNLALPLGVVGHEGSTVLVVLNGLRLLGLKKF